jgi:putative ATP-dependent endonuclease of OLD family
MSLQTDSMALPLPYILIEFYMEGEDLAELERKGNHEKSKPSGISLEIAFDEKYQSESAELIKLGNIKTLPIEYYASAMVRFCKR